jgi:hypothetical protein
MKRVQRFAKHLGGQDFLKPRNPCATATASCPRPEIRSDFAMALRMHWEGMPQTQRQIDPFALADAGRGCVLSPGQSHPKSSDHPRLPTHVEVMSASSPQPAGCGPGSCLVANVRTGTRQGTTPSPSNQGHAGSLALGPSAATGAA